MRKFAVTGLLCSILSPALAQTSWLENATQLKLVDELDMPGEGYCIDIVGAGTTMRFDMPLIAYNCVLGLFPDRTVTMRNDGTLFFPAFDGCVTVMGLNERALPGTSVMIKPCGQDTPFLEARKFQKFEKFADGRLSLMGSELCLSAGPDSHATYSQTHRWRILSVEKCNLLPDELSIWEQKTVEN